MLNADIQEIQLIGKETERVLLKKTAFDLEANKIFTILGKNGSGKSTLIKSLTKLLDERFYLVTGKILFNGNDLLKISPDELLEIRRNRIKYVFQDAVNSFDPLKTFKYYFDNLVKNQEEISSLLKYFILPDQDKLLNLYPYEVSGGMAQRISFVLTLLSHPDIIILDEPTSGIDSAIANLFLLKLKEFATEKNNCVLLVTQDIDFAEKVSDKIAYLHEGQLSTFYTNEEFFKIKTNDMISSFLNLRKGFNN